MFCAITFTFLTVGANVMALLPLNITRRSHKTRNQFCTEVAVDTWKSACAPQSRDKVALRITCIKNVKNEIIKIKTSCHCT